MYQPPHHREDRLDVQHAFIRAHPFGTLVTMSAGRLVANSIPFVLEDASPYGILKGHVARANTQWRESDPQPEALVIFQGADRYITPTWYPTKREHGKVVPTWNYEMVHAWGSLRAIEDRDWLARQVRALTNQHEAARSEPWAVTDAPPTYIEAQLRGIVGIEIPVTRIEGKWKVSQNRPEADRAGVVEGLRASGDGESLVMAALVEGRGPSRPR
jgi:transcriptional regulator